MSEQEAANPVFTIEKLYVKDFSIEVPNAPAIFLERDSPAVEVQLQSSSRSIDDSAYEVLLTVTVTAKLGEKTVFLVEVGQSGIFQIRNIPTESLDPLLSVACPNLLFPYAREAISDATARAGFAPVLLQPVNFEALYMARKEQEKAAPAPSDASKTN